MKKLTLYLLAVCGALCSFGNAQETVEKKEGRRELAGWGTAVDSDNDCKFFLAEDALLISVPGSRPHDLAADIGLVNAPRVLQNVNGDFTIQVRVEGRFAPGDESTKAGRGGYNGAAIVAMADERNVVTLARAVLHHSGAVARSYANFEMRVGGELLRIGHTGDHPLPNDGPVFLRLERRGAMFHGAASVDGVNWTVLESKEVPADWPKELQAGIAAISTSTEEFSPRFSGFQIIK